MECTDEVIAVSDFVGSTSEIIDFATNTDCEKFIICTEMGIFLNYRREIRIKSFVPLVTGNFVLI